MRKPIIAGNWKMNKTPAQAKELVNELIPLAKDMTCEVVVCPPAIDLPTVSEAIKGTNIALGAQNVHWKESGAFTGEISADMLKELGVKYAIVGHSERRGMFGDTDETVNARATFALRNGITPIICVGESEDIRDNGDPYAFVAAQVKAALSGFTAESVASIVIAYEPIWAIGTGKTATSEQAEKMAAHIRKAVAALYNEATAGAVRIQYGGSMKPSNSDELMAMPDIDGGLIGGAALKAADFAGILKSAK